MAGAAAAVSQVGAAESEVEAVTARLRPRFRRRAAHRHAGAYLRGLLADVERKNGWQLAEHAGYAHPRTIQRVLDRSAWDPDEVRDDLREFVLRTAPPHHRAFVMRSSRSSTTAPTASQPGAWLTRSPTFLIPQSVSPCWKPW